MVALLLFAHAGRKGEPVWAFRFFRQKTPRARFSLYALPTSHRLHHAQEFTAVIRFRCTASGEFFQISAKPNSLAHPRLGLIVAGKVVRHAVERNRVKRLLREVFRARQRDLAGLDLVVRLRKRPTVGTLAATTGSQLVAEAETLMIQLRRCHAPS